MDTTERKLRERIAEELGDLVENIILKKSPYDSIPLHPESSHFLLNYYQYESDIEEPFKTSIINANIAWGRFYLKQILLGSHGEPFSKLFPEHSKTKDEFCVWIKEKELANKQYPIAPIIESPLKKSNVNKCVKEVIKKRYPHFRVDNKPFGSIGYYTEFDTIKQYILVNTGSWRTSLSFMLGIGHPQFCMDVACFFGGVQSHYAEGYHSIEQIYESTGKALDLIDAILPHFTNSLAGVLTT